MRLVPNSVTSGTTKKIASHNMPGSISQYGVNRPPRFCGWL